MTAPRDLTVFLDNGGVLNDNDRRATEWGRLIGDFLPPRLGGIRQAWTEANRAVFERQWDRFEVWRSQLTPGEWGNFFESPEERERWLREMCEHVGVAAPSADDCVHLAAEVEDYVIPRIRAAHPGAAGAVRELQAAGYHLSTASGQLSHELAHYLTGMGIRGCFTERLYGPDLVRTPKAGPLFYERIFADAVVAPARAVVVDDMPLAVGWAAEAGARTVLVSPDPATLAPHSKVSRLVELPSLLDQWAS